jgi:hypothetical protein
MQLLTYGISHPLDLLDKMIHDGNKIEPDFNKYDVFNFIVTTAVLNEWIDKYYKFKKGSKIKSAIHGASISNIEGFPVETLTWIQNTSCFPNPENNLKKQIQECIIICHYTCNASKHFHWNMDKNKQITAIEPEPKIKDWYQFFFTKTGPGVYIEYNNIYYCITQIRDILIQFYSGLIPYLEKRKA